MAIGAKIEAWATSRAHPWPLPRDALHLADDAAKECLERATRRPSDVDLLINAGIYRKDNLAEPSLASMIQEDIGANLGHPPREDAHGTFSFDVSGGGCGVVTGLQLLHGFLESHTIRCGLLVTSDSDPGNSESFPFPPVGGALLLVPSDGAERIVDFAFETFDEGDARFESVVSWHATEKHGPFGRSGRNVLTIAESDAYARAVVDSAAAATGRFLARHGIRAADVDLVVPSQSPRGFPMAFAGAAGFPSGVVAQASGPFEGAHTAGPIAALEGAREAFLAARRVLFVTVGAGIEVALCLYER